MFKNENEASISLPLETCITVEKIEKELKWSTKSWIQYSSEEYEINVVSFGIQIGIYMYFKLHCPFFIRLIRSFYLQNEITLFDNFKD